jgi:hypothetical protein
MLSAFFTTKSFMFSLTGAVNTATSVLSFKNMELRIVLLVKTVLLNASTVI